MPLSQPPPSNAPQPKPAKLSRLPSNARIHKRPLLRPPIPSPYTSSHQPKVVYISTHTPFISAVKRVRKLLALVEQRSSGKINLIDDGNNNGRTHKQKLRALTQSVGGGVGGGKMKEEVILKATNRAIEKALGLAVFFQGQEDLRVSLRTGSQGVVDDVEEMEKTVGGTKVGKKGITGDGEEAKDMEDAEEEEQELPETRIRKVSVLEVRISLR
ncbi:MAG: hypothetical protein Q9201_005880 [Fulgogasparrea decipioides]